MKQQLTIKDVARALGISDSTVSRAMTNAPDVAVATKNAVIRMAKQLGYRPDYAAQCMVSGKTRLIGVVVPVIHSNYFSDALGGMTDVLLNHNYQLIVCQSNESKDIEARCIRKLLTFGIEGLLISVAKSTKNGKAINEVKARNIPVVMFDRILKSVECSKVIVDEYEGSYKAVEHLIKKGCKTIAHLAGPKDLSITYNRKQGYLDALRDNGIRVNQNIIVHCKSFEDDAPAAFKKILSATPAPDGIFFINDLSAIDGMRYIRRKGIAIPKNIRIVGFNNDPVSSMSEPTLTTVMQPSYEVGKLSIGILIDEMEGKLKKFVEHKLRTRLIVRQSSR